VRWPEPYNPWGTPFRDLMVRGYVDGVVVAEHKIDASHTPHALNLTVSSDSLKADGSDMLRIVAQIVDKYGNVLPYQMRNVRFTLDGDAELIGENPLILLGGQGACYVKSGYTIGDVMIHAHTDQLPEAKLILHIGGLSADNEY
jgi:beta-galactosidase